MSFNSFFFLTNFTVCFFGTTIQRLHYWLVFVEYKLSIKYSTIGTFTPKPQDKKEQISTIQLTTRPCLFMKISFQKYEALLCLMSVQYSMHWENREVYLNIMSTFSETIISIPENLKESSHVWKSAFDPNHSKKFSW